MCGLDIENLDSFCTRGKEKKDRLKNKRTKGTLVQSLKEGFWKPPRVTVYSILLARSESEERLKNVIFIIGA